jgi:glycosyltransferase involved in cell wall biosynthesis
MSGRSNAQAEIRWPQADALSTAHSTGTEPIRVALVCDFLEEHWPSMNLVGDMVTWHLTEGFRNEIAVSQIRPAMRQRFSRISTLGEKSARNADRLVNRFFDYPWFLRAMGRGFNLFHLIDHSYSQVIHGLPEGRTVVTCHDLDTFRCLLEPDREVRSPWFRAMTRRILDGFRKAVHVLAVSAATRDELLLHDLFPPQRISVVPNGVHPACSPLPDAASDEEAARLLRGRTDADIWLLSVGSTIARKRLDVLLRVFASVKREIPEARLLRVGGDFTAAQRHLAEELNIANAVTILPFLSPNVLASVYRRSALLLHTAEAEGFGLPVIEAMACGCPVIASDLAVLREAGGQAVTYCKVADVDAWKNTAIFLLRERSRDGDALALRRSNGLTQAAHFSWAENARQTAGIYQEILAAY